MPKKPKYKMQKKKGRKTFSLMKLGKSGKYYGKVEGISTRQMKRPKNIRKPTALDKKLFR